MWWMRRIFCLNYINFRVGSQYARYKFEVERVHQERDAVVLYGITPVYVYRMWGGSVAIEEIEKAIAELQSHRKHR